jgi:heterodisulfide reductase subunit B
LNSRFSLFSGIDFTIDIEKGLNGYCDFIISSGLEQLFVAAPVMMLVEAKNEDIKSGVGQCVAEMYAAQLFNQRENNGISAVYGAVTTGTNWKFIKLEGTVVEIDLSEYYLSNLNKILGILSSFVD